MEAGLLNTLPITMLLFVTVVTTAPAVNTVVVRTGKNYSTDS